MEPETLRAYMDDKFEKLTSKLDDLLIDKCPERHRKLDADIAALQSRLIIVCGIGMFILSIIGNVFAKYLMR